MHDNSEELSHTETNSHNTSGHVPRTAKPRSGIQKWRPRRKVQVNIRLLRRCPPHRNHSEEVQIPSGKNMASEF